jgi:DNA-binding transcriptional MerR regulator
VQNLLSIQAFSEKTGIPKSTLRYYEEAGLLIPTRNQENGYRLYQEAQIELATWIASLRLVNIPLKEIKLYLMADEEKKITLKENWKQTLNRQRQLLDVQLKFLGNHSDDKGISLMETPEDRILWFEAEEDQGKFGKRFLQGEKELRENDISVTNYYLKYVSGRKRVKAWLGFGVNDTCSTTHLHNLQMEEKLVKSLCVAQSFKGDFSKIEVAYKRVVQYVSEHHFVPVGPMMEMYRGKNLDDVMLFIPVMKLGGEEDVSGS